MERVPTQQEMIDAFLAGKRPEYRLGPGAIDSVIVTALRKLAEGEWLTAREAAAKTGLTLETASRALSRLTTNGSAEANNRRPRGYRWLPFVVELPQGFSRERPIGKSWKEHLETPERYPDGVRVMLFVLEGTERVGDGENALIRMERIGQPDPAARKILATVAREQRVDWDGKELFVDPITTEALPRLAKASADAVQRWCEAGGR